MYKRQVYRIGLLLGRDDGGRASRTSAVALTAALLAAVNPFLIHYSQEARMYSLLAWEYVGPLLIGDARPSTPLWTGTVWELSLIHI